MKKLVFSTLWISSALAIGACTKDKKPSTTEPATSGSATTSDSTKTDPANPPQPAKPDETKPATGGW